MTHFPPLPSCESLGSHEARFEGGLNAWERVSGLNVTWMIAVFLDHHPCVMRVFPFWCRWPLSLLCQIIYIVILKWVSLVPQMLMHSWILPDELALCAAPATSTRMWCVEEISLSFSDTPGAYGTTMLLWKPSFGIYHKVWFTGTADLSKDELFFIAGWIECHVCVTSSVNTQGTWLLFKSLEVRT